MNSGWKRAQVSCMPDLVNVFEFIAKVKTVPICAMSLPKPTTWRYVPFDEVRTMKNFPCVEAMYICSMFCPLEIIARRYDPFYVTRIKENLPKKYLGVVFWDV
jgi:hypothetical protein